MSQEFRSLGVSAAFSRWSLDDSFSAVAANILLSTLGDVGDAFKAKRRKNSQTSKLLNSQGQAELAKVE